MASTTSFRYAATRKFVEVPEIGLAPRVSLIGGEFVETRRFAAVLWQAAALLRVNEVKADQSVCISLVGGEHAEARRLTVVLWQAAFPL